jgi:Helix-turn-helix domain of transposase family ISL3
MLLLVSGATATLRRHLGSPFLGHLLVPGAGNSMRDLHATGFPWAVDNAAFSGFDPAAFAALLGRIAGQPGCRFVACPDVVGDARATLEQFQVWQPLLRLMDLPVALVGQDGLENLEVPWDRIQALFLGGSTAWKLSAAAAGLAREARRRGLWVHLGRCNSLRRLRHAYAIGCDSVDGSAFSRWPDHHIPRTVGWLAMLHSPPEATAGSISPAGEGPLPVGRRPARALLDLPGWVVQTAHRRPGEYQLTARYLPEPDVCLRCGAGRLLVRGLRRHGSQRQRFRDLARGKRHVVLWVNRLRYRCLACGRTFLQPLPDRAPGRRLTRRLAAYVSAQVATRSCRGIAREVGINERTVRTLARRATP